MTRTILALVLALASVAAHANCVGHFIYRADGTSIYCQTCCNNGYCTTVCV